MGAGSGKLVKMLGGDASAKEAIFKQVDADKGKSVSRDELGVFVERVFSLFAKDPEQAETGVPFSKNNTFGKWAELSDATKHNILADVTDALMAVLDSDKDGSVSRAEWDQFDWTKLLPSMMREMERREEEKAEAKRIKEEKMAEEARRQEEERKQQAEEKKRKEEEFRRHQQEVEEKIKSFVPGEGDTPLCILSRISDGRYLFVGTHEIGADADLYWNSDIKENRVESAEDKRLKPVAERIVWPFLITHDRAEIKVECKVQGHKCQFHGDKLSYGPFFQCQEEERRFIKGWGGPNVHFTGEAVVIYFKAHNPGNAVNPKVPYVVCGQLYQVKF